jgi:hypothetical protein
VKILRRVIPLIAYGAFFAVCIDTRPPPASLSVAGTEISGLLVSHCWSSACSGACADGPNRTPAPVRVRVAAPAQARLLIDEPRELHVRVGPSLDNLTEVSRDRLLLVAGLNVVSVSAWWPRGDAYYTFAVDVEQP